MSKIWASSRVLRHGVVTLRSSVGPRHGVACSHRGMAEKEAWPASGTLQRRDAMPRRSYCLRMEMFMFCFVFFFVSPRTCLLD